VDGPDPEILLPKRYVPEGVEPGDTIKVFIYRDSEDRIIATTEHPIAIVDEFACLKVKSLTKFGAFLDWGISKDLLVPFSEQVERMEEGKYYLVRVYLDEASRRIVASTKINKFLIDQEIELEVDDEVDILVCESNDLGTRVIVNNEHVGILFKNELFRDVHPGEKTKGFVKNIRPDNKIDVSLQRQGYQEISITAKGQVLAELKAKDGFLPLTDKTAPDIIYLALKMSKKNFKKAIGALYKEKVIRLEKDGIYLI